MGLRPDERRELLDDVTAHSLAVILCVGFFSIIFVAMLGYVDLKDPAVTGFLGIALGSASTMLLVALRWYFKQPESEDVESK